MSEDNREKRNKLRHIIDKAAKNNMMGPEEVGFIITLTERFRVDIEKKIRQLHMLQGEIAQLRSNEQVIINLVEQMLAAADRDKARRDTYNKIRGIDSEETDAAEEEEEDTNQEIED
jgi:hypothetical protein